MENLKETKDCKVIDINTVYSEESHEEKYLKSKYDFQYNEVLSKPEYRLKTQSSEEYIELDEVALNSLYRELRNNKVKCSRDNLSWILKSDFCQSYNPFHDYLNNLPEWDQQSDHILELANTIKTTDDDYWQRTLKKWLVALVGSLLDDQTINHQVLVLYGPQGIGKTRWTDKLVPNILRKYYYSGTIYTNNKDTAIHLAECMLINLDELENLQRRELGSLKEVITRNEVRVRRPYAKFAESYPHRASFIGSVNQRQFLHDQTGSRRFLVHEVVSIDANHSIDIGLVYAQALSLYKDGFKYWVDGDEIKEVLAKNDSFEYKPIEEELLLRHFKPGDKGNAEAFLQTTEILRILEDTYGFRGRLVDKKLGEVLNKHGFKLISKNHRYVRAVRYANKRYANK